MPVKRDLERVGDEFDPACRPRIETADDARLRQSSTEPS
jgi:hypothetical protein